MPSPSAPHDSTERPADKSHPSVQHYRDHKEEYDTNNFLSFVKFMAERNPHLKALRERQEYRAFVAMCEQENPFRSILEKLHEIPLADLEWLNDEMPSGYPRARVCDRMDEVKRGAPVAERMDRQ